jgi:ABC-type uncharacterized transport system substrate-binding protein
LILQAKRALQEIWMAETNALLPVIGYLDPRSADATADLVRGFRQGLKEAGYVEGEDVAIEHRWAENQLDRLPALAADLASRRVAVIVASSSAAAFAAKNATTTVPIVFVPDDPVRLGLVASLARPGGKLTGINWFATEVKLLRDMVPATTRLALLVEPNNPTITEPTVRDVEAAARAMGLQMRILHANTSREIDAVFATSGFTSLARTFRSASTKPYGRASMKATASSSKPWPRPNARARWRSSTRKTRWPCKTCVRKGLSKS